MSVSALKGFLMGGLIIIIGGFLGWIGGKIIVVLLQNSTGGYDSTITASLAPLIEPIFIAFGFLVGFIVMVLSALKAVGGK